MNIFVNQIGYLPKGKKIAVVELENEAEKHFFVKDLSGAVAFQGEISSPQDDKMAGGRYALMDFSALDLSGNYIVTFENQKSYPFAIGEGVYDDLYKSVLKYFTLSRCGCACDDKIFGHVPCHAEPAQIYGTDKKIDAAGGWHDAGDYGRYVVAASKAIMDLLLAYESEPNHNLFDVLGEVRWALEWMLKMQREDGAVYHKVTSNYFCGFILPEDEKDLQIVSPVSTAATADFAGCLAFASGFFTDDAEFAEKLKNAALKAQSYLDTHQDEPFKNPPDIRTGEYGSWKRPLDVERYFALCSLFYMTGDNQFLTRAIEMRHKNSQLFDGPFGEGFGWGWVAGYGTELLLKALPKKGDEKGGENKEKIEIRAELESAILKNADRIIGNVEQNIFAFANGHAAWGSNGAIMDSAHMLSLAYSFTADRKYAEAAIRQVHYVLGVNPMNICYVTGNGTDSVKNPHHRPSGALKQTMPGMLSGGPCQDLLDEVAKNNLVGKAPLKCFIDHVGSYSTNEIDNYWNSPLALGLAKVPSLIQ